LSIESVNRKIAEEKDSIIYWDEWVLALIKEAARKELSRHSLNELWRPLGDTSDTNPLDEIAKNMKGNVSDQIRSNGIKLVAARIIDFQFESEEAKKVLDQQIDNWVSYMEQSISKTNSDADAKSNKIEKEAVAYARSNLLAAIAKGLDQIGENYENIPKKYVVAIRLIVALEDALRKSTEHQNSADENNDGINKKMDAFRSSLKNFNNPTKPG
jgi:regulator of protease activity HflC (stomatin/prohibitin superfamily)